MAWKTPMNDIPEDVRETLSRAKHGDLDGWDNITLPETVPQIYKLRHGSNGEVYTVYSHNGSIRITDDHLQDWTGVLA